MFNPIPFASAENREIYHTVLAQRLKIETARKASERKKDLERIPKVEEAIQKVINWNYNNSEQMLRWLFTVLNKLQWSASIPSWTTR